MIKLRIVVVDTPDGKVRVSYCGSDAAEAEKIFAKEAQDPKLECVRIFNGPVATKSRRPSHEAGILTATSNANSLALKADLAKKTAAANAAQVEAQRLLGAVEVAKAALHPVVEAPKTPNDDPKQKSHEPQKSYRRNS